MRVMSGLDHKFAAASWPSHSESPEHLSTHPANVAAARDVSRARQAIAQLERYLTLLSSAVGDELAGFEAGMTPRPRPHSLAVPIPSQVHATIFVIDGDGAVRGTLHQLFRPRGWVVHTYACAEEFLGADRSRERVGCLVVEASLPGMDGLTLLSLLQAEAYTLPAVVMAAPGDVRLAVAAMRAGAADCIEKPIRPDTMVACVAQVLDRATDHAEQALSRRLGAHRIASLTARERQIMDLVVAGHANKEIAARVALSQRTVEKHRAAVMRKTGAGSLADLIRIGLAVAGPSGVPLRMGPADRPTGLHTPRAGASALANAPAPGLTG
jgi:FixJ family two-component response regulator